MNQESLAPPPLTRASNLRWSRLFVLAFIFGCGGVVGAVMGGAWVRTQMLDMLQAPADLSDRIMSRIGPQLSLTDEQQVRVKEIVRRRHAHMESLRAEAYPKQMAEFAAMRAEVDALLSPDQRPRWSALCESIERRFLPARPAGPPPADLIFTRFDENHDDALHIDEVPAGMWRRLGMADKNGDDRVTRREYAETQSGFAPSPPVQP